MQRMAAVEVTETMAPLPCASIRGRTALQHRKALSRLTSIWLSQVSSVMVAGSPGSERPTLLTRRAGGEHGLERLRQAPGQEQFHPSAVPRRRLPRPPVAGPLHQVALEVRRAGAGAGAAAAARARSAGRRQGAGGHDGGAALLRAAPRRRGHHLPFRARLRAIPAAGPGAPPLPRE